MFFVISKFQVSILSGTRDMIDPFLRAGSSRLKRTLVCYWWTTRSLAWYESTVVSAVCAHKAGRVVQLRINCWKSCAEKRRFDLHKSCQSMCLTLFSFLSRENYGQSTGLTIFSFLSRENYGQRIGLTVQFKSIAMFHSLVSRSGKVFYFVKCICMKLNNIVSKPKTILSPFVENRASVISNTASELCSKWIQAVFLQSTQSGTVCPFVTR